MSRELRVVGYTLHKMQDAELITQGAANGEIYLWDYRRVARRGF
jgi:hypothetical protein